MREMRDSGIKWLGQFPSRWELLRAKSIFQLTNERGNDELVLLAATQRFGMFPQHLLEGVVRVKEDTDLSTFRTVHKNDFVISLRSFQGGFEMSEFEGVCSPAYQTFCAKQAVVHRYYKYLFKCGGFVDYLNSLTQGIREGKTIKYEDFAVCLIPKPPLDEQRCIADYLDAKCAEIDRAIEAAEKSIEEYESYRRSLVTYGTACKRTSKRVRLRNLCSRIFDGPFGSHLKSTDYIDEGIRVVRLENLKYMRFDDSKQSFISHEKYKTISRHTVTPDDLIMATFVAKEVQVVELPSYVEFAVNKADCVGLRLNGIACKRFVQYALSSNAVLSYLQGQLHGTTRGRVNTSQIKTIPLALPPLDEQRRIVNYLDEKCVQIDRAIAAKQAIIADLKAYKQSLIYEVVTGKREV